MTIWSRGEFLWHKALQGSNTEMNNQINNLFLIWPILENITYIEFSYCVIFNQLWCFLFAILVFFANYVFLFLFIQLVKTFSFLYGTLGVKLWPSLCTLFCRWCFSSWVALSVNSWKRIYILLYNPGLFPHILYKLGKWLSICFPIFY